MQSKQIPFLISAWYFLFYQRTTFHQNFIRNLKNMVDKFERVVSSAMFTCAPAGYPRRHNNSISSVIMNHFTIVEAGRGKPCWTVIAQWTVGLPIPQCKCCGYQVIRIKGQFYHKQYRVQFNGNTLLTLLYSFYLTCNICKQIRLYVCSDGILQLNLETAMFNQRAPSGEDVTKLNQYFQKQWFKKTVCYVAAKKKR